MNSRNWIGAMKGLLIVFIIPVCLLLTGAGRFESIRQFDTEEEAIAWRMEIEEQYQGSGDAYTLIWEGPTLIITQTRIQQVPVPQGDPVVTVFGPFDTFLEAQEGLKDEKASDSSRYDRIVSFSKVQNHAGEGRIEYVLREEGFGSELQRDRKLEQTVYALNEAGMNPCDPAVRRYSYRRTLNMNDTSGGEQVCYGFEVRYTDSSDGWYFTKTVQEYALHETVETDGVYEIRFRAERRTVQPESEGVNTCGFVLGLVLCLWMLCWSRSRVIYRRLR